MSHPDRSSAPQAIKQTTVDLNGAARITFLALARNCEQTLPLLFSLCDEAEHQGFKVRCKVGENGSIDGTRAAILKRMSIDPRLSLVQTDAMAKAPNRLARMAIGRELLRRAWIEDGPSDDLVCVVDVDGVLPEQLKGLVDLKGAAARLSSDMSIAGISANSTPFYYDLLALRVPALFNYDVGPSLALGTKSPLFHYLVHKNLVYPMQRELTRRLPLKTSSSFNGMALYRAADYLNSSYLRLEHIDECEHVDFNRQVCEPGRAILAGDWFRLKMPSEHGPRGLIGFVAQRFSKVIKR